MYFNDKHIYVLSLDTYFLFVYLAEIILLKLLYLSNFFKKLPSIYFKQFIPKDLYFYCFSNYI